MLSAKVPYYILDLLQQVPNVFVQGLGRFDAIFHPAVLDIPKSQINPPYVEPDFTPGDGSDEKLLASYIHYVSGADPVQAEEAIADFVQLIKEHTQGGNSYAIEKFGIFSQTSQGAIRFTPDWDAFNLSFSGLEILDLKPVEESVYTPPVHTPPVYTPQVYTTPEPVPAHTYSKKEDTHVSPEEMHVEIDKAKESITQELLEEIIKVQDNVEESTSRLWWVILSCALFLILILCGYLAWDIISNRQKLNGLAKVQPDTTTTIPSDIITPIDTPIATVPEPVPEEKPDTITKPATPSDVASACFVVVGAFANQANVSRMEERLKSLGYTSELKTGGSLTRVAIRTSCEPDSLQKVLNDARSNINPEAWIY